MKKKLCYIISFIHQSNELEWTLEELKKKYNLFVILLNPVSNDQYRNCQFVSFIKSGEIPLYLIDYNGKKDFLRAFFRTYVYLRKIKPSIVHAHLFDASLIGLLSSYLLGIKHRVYTRHHSSFHHVFFPHVVKYDKLINRLSSKIIAISKVVKDILIFQENVSPQKIQTIYHGNNAGKIMFDENAINNIKNKYSLQNKFPVIGIVSRYIEWKGIQFIIPAFRKLLPDYPNARLVLCGIGGNFSVDIKKLLSSLLQNTYTEIIFESDIWNLYKTFDVVIHTPIDNHSEAFGQVYIEAMYSKIPLVCTKSGIANELLVHEKNSLLCDYQNADSILINLKKILSDKTLRENMIQNAYKDVQQYSFQNKIQSLLNLYSQMN